MTSNNSSDLIDLIHNWFKSDGYRQYAIEPTNYYILPGGYEMIAEFNSVGVTIAPYCEDLPRWGAEESLVERPYHELPMEALAWVIKELENGNLFRAANV